MYIVNLNKYNSIITKPIEKTFSIVKVKGKIEEKQVLEYRANDNKHLYVDLAPKHVTKTVE